MSLDLHKLWPKELSLTKVRAGHVDTELNLTIKAKASLHAAEGKSQAKRLGTSN